MAPFDVSRSSLADVLIAVAVAQMPERKRQDMASGVRTVARAIGRDPADIPADPRLLAIRLRTVSPLALGLSPGRWNNVRSLLRAALALMGPVMKGRDETPLSEAWEELSGILASKYSAQIRNSKIMHWMSRHRIQPQAVTMADIELFKVELFADPFLSNPAATWRDKCWAWNHAVANIPGWPQIPLTVVSRQFTWVLSWSAFTLSLKQDVDRWLYRLSGQDFADDGPSRPARKSTLATREYQLRAFASALVLRGRDPAGLISLAVCLTLENFTEGLRYYQERHGGKNSRTTHQLASMLTSVARHWLKAEEATLKRMSGIARKLAPEATGMTQKNRTRLKPFEAPAVLHDFLNLPQTLRRHVETKNITLREKRVLAQVAVAIELLIFTGIRVGNLASITFEQHLIAVGRKLHLSFQSSEVKNNMDLDFDLPDESKGLIDWYSKNYRQAASENRALFPGRTGGSKKLHTLSGQIIKTVQKFLGLQVHPHLFRQIAVKFYLDQNPGGYEVMRLVLGHKQMATTTKFYTGQETRAANRHFAETIMKLRTSHTKDQT